jgi:CHAT domain-containing protein
MLANDLVEQLIASPDADSQQRLLNNNVSSLNDQVAVLLKERADQYLRADLARSQAMVDLLKEISELTGSASIRALGYLAEANLRGIGMGDYQQALSLYDQAAEIYRAETLPLEQAKSQVGKVGVLAFLGRYDEAIELGDWASQVLEDYQAWRPLATLIMNLAIMHARRGEDSRALLLFGRAGEIYWKLGEANEPGWLWVQLNCAYVLRNLGRFEESIQASQTAREGLIRIGQEISAVRAQQMLALTYFVQGKYNLALENLDQAREAYLKDGRQRDAVLVELFISDCLLKLRRFNDVLEKCDQVRQLFTALGTRQVVAQAIVNEAVAYTQMGNHTKALESLVEARQIFEELGNQVWQAVSDLEIAAVTGLQGSHTRSLQAAQACIEVFQDNQLVVEQAKSMLVAAQAAYALEDYPMALRYLQSAMTIADAHQLATLKYQGFALLGKLKLADGDRQGALDEYRRAVQEIELLRGGLMVEFRVGFLEDKAKIYEDVVDLLLRLDQPIEALEYVERAKSRALLDLLAYRLDIGIQARGEADLPLVNELLRLRQERDRLYRRWESNRETDDEVDRTPGGGKSQAQREVLKIEHQITELWHRLLIRNADYAREASLWLVHTEDIRPYLPADTILLEYYLIGNQPVAFLLSKETVQVMRLEADISEIQMRMNMLRLNLEAVLNSPAAIIPALTTNARSLLKRIYDLIIAPLAVAISPYKRLIIVPHGSLHYLPFHALYDGGSYLLEKFEVSYLPASSFLRYCQETAPEKNGSLAVGYSDNGRLAYAPLEASAVADLLSGRVLAESQASIAAIEEQAPACRLLHFAVHGDFRADNPLFSGLKLADGWLTTLDIFNLQLSASLVTLSACQTGRSVIAAGDELLGLMRAFLGTGSSSLVLSLWKIEDRFTGRLMESFYTLLARGWDKGAALREAQLQFIRASDTEHKEGGVESHPYFWGAFFLVGDSGPL